MGNFSAHDLIRNKIADPPVFEPPPQGSPPDEIVVLTHEDGIPKNDVGNVNNRWSFSINPLSYFQRSDNAANSRVAPKSDSQEAGQEVGQNTGPISSPQLTSTPTE